MIKFMIDSASDCRSGDFYDYFVPIKVNIGGKEYSDGIDLDNDTFYRLLTESDEFPTTSQPSPEVFLEIFEQIKADGDELIYFALSSALSGTYQSANIAKSMAGYDKIYIIDTKTVTHMIGLLAKYAKDLAVNGVSAVEIVEKCEVLKTKIKVFAGLDTLEYLQKGGRIGKAAALVGTIANLKPIVTVSEEGSVDAVGKTLGFLRAVQQIVGKTKQFEIDESFGVYSLYTEGTENCEKLEAALKNDGIEVKDQLRIGSSIGAHVGPGVYGIFFVTK